MYVTIQRFMLMLALTLAGPMSFTGLAWAQPVKTPATPPKTAPGKGPATPAVPAKVHPSDEFFAKGPIPQLRIRLTKEEEQKLRANQRAYVLCTLIEDGKTTYEGVRVKLKGAAGSFRNLDDRPAFTLNMGKGKPEFHGLDKFHLNNSVQDESYMSEMLCSQLCRDAGLPAARATHARVWLNDRDLGFYGLKEGFNEDFIKANFPGTEGKGNLYDGGFLQDIDANLERDEGEGADDKADLKALLAAAREPDVTKRATLLAERLDIDAFINFMALELMMCHWDGYTNNKNNYRIYFHVTTKKAVFIPHGMDQMFGDANFPVFNVPGTILPGAVLNVPEWKVKYQKRVRELLPMFAPDKLHARIDAAHKRIRPIVAATISEDRAKQLDDRIRDFRGRLNGRQAAISAQMPAMPLAFGKENWVAVEGWAAKPEGDAKLETKVVAGRTMMAIETGPSKNCVASYRAKVLLEKGRYRLEGKVRTTSVKIINDNKGAGAGLRLGHADRGNSNRAVGTAGWSAVGHIFEITEPQREVELVAELRSTGGAAVFDGGAMRVVKLK